MCLKASEYSDTVTPAIITVMDYSEQRANVAVNVHPSQPEPLTAIAGPSTT